MKTGIELIAEERREQIEKHGRTIERDIEINTNDELAAVASVLAYPYHYADDLDDYPESWDEDALRNMISKPRIERLTIAGALIAAEIDRLQRIIE
ncbi:hypothetical protein D9M70_598820 [compost metagenome]